MAANTDTGLMLRLEASLAKFERQMQRARQVGGTAARGIQSDFDRTNQRLAQGTTRAAQGLTGVMNVSSRGRFVLQNTAAQMGDIAVQLEGGTKASRVMAQQLPQLFGGFGALGGALGIVMPLLGTLAAVGIPIAAFFWQTRDNATEAAESIDTLSEALEEAVSRFRDFNDRATMSTMDLSETYGRNAAAARELLDIQRQMAEMDAQRALSAISQALVLDFGFNARDLVNPDDIARGQEAIRELQDEIVSLSIEMDRVGATPALGQAFDEAEARLLALESSRSAIDGLAESLNVTEAQARALAAGFAELGNAQGPRAQADAYRAMAMDIYDVTGGLTDADEATVMLYYSLLNAWDQALQFAAVDLSAGISPAVDAAARLVDELSAARRIAAGFGGGRGNAGPGGPVIGQDDSGRFDWQAPGALDEADALLRAERVAGRRATGGGGGGAAEQDFLAASRRQIEQMQLQIDTLGLTAGETARLTAERQALSAAMQAGADLDLRNAETGRTLREEIEAQAAEVGRLADALDQAQINWQEYQRGIKSVSDALAGAIVQGNSLGEALGNAFRSIAQSWISNGLQSIFSSIGGGIMGGGGGGFNPLGFLTGRRAMGGPVQAGGLYAVNENTPNTEFFAPSVNGAILTPAQVQAGLRQGSAGAAGGQSRVVIELGEGVEGRILEQARGQSVQIVSASARAQNQRFAARASDARVRGV